MLMRMKRRKKPKNEKENAMFIFEVILSSLIQLEIFVHSI